MVWNLFSISCRKKGHVSVSPLVLPCPGGVIVMVCAVNSSSKYRVSVSEVTWGLNGGTSCWRGDRTQTYQHISAVSQFGNSCWSDDNLYRFWMLPIQMTQLNRSPEGVTAILVCCHFRDDNHEKRSKGRGGGTRGSKGVLETDLLFINILPFNSCKEPVLHDFLGVIRPST